MLPDRLLEREASLRQLAKTEAARLKEARARLQSAERSVAQQSPEKSVGAARVTLGSGTGVGANVARSEVQGDDVEVGLLQQMAKQESLRRRQPADSSLSAESALLSLAAGRGAPELSASPSAVYDVEVLGGAHATRAFADGVCEATPSAKPRNKQAKASQRADERRHADELRQRQLRDEHARHEVEMRHRREARAAEASERQRQRDEIRKRAEAARAADALAKQRRDESMRLTLDESRRVDRSELLAVARTAAKPSGVRSRSLSAPRMRPAQSSTPSDRRRSPSRRPSPAAQRPTLSSPPRLHGGYVRSAPSQAATSLLDSLLDAEAERRWRRKEEDAMELLSQDGSRGSRPISPLRSSPPPSFK